MYEESLKDYIYHNGDDCVLSYENLYEFIISLDFKKIDITKVIIHSEYYYDDLIIWYELFQDIESEVFKKAIIELCKERAYKPTIHDILNKTKTVMNNYYLSILEQMKKDGYFKLGEEPLPPEQEDRNYGKSIRWIEREIIPGFLLEDMQKYIDHSKRINSKKHYQIENNR